jgi:tetratricopeptide (TPR) repeat protein
MRLNVCTAMMLFAVSSTALGQSAADEIAAGDRAYAALEEPAALEHYQKAVAADPKNYEALWKASRSAIDYGIPQASDAKRNASFATGEQYARRAVEANPNDAEGHFVLAWVLGKTALTQSARSRVKYGTDVHTHAMECLRLKPAHAGCLHIMGVWNAEIMRLNSFVRLIAKSILGGKVFGEANWNNAVRYMEAAVAAEPQRVVHRLDMGEVYRDIGQKEKAREQWNIGLQLPSTDYNDPRFKGDIQADLGRLGT